EAPAADDAPAPPAPVADAAQADADKAAPDAAVVAPVAAASPRLPESGSAADAVKAQPAEGPQAKASGPPPLDRTASVAQPQSEPALLIVPLDHDLVAQRDEPFVASAAHSVNDNHAEAAPAESPSAKPAIDPLLRMFEGK